MCRRMIKRAGRNERIVGNTQPVGYGINDLRCIQRGNDSLTHFNLRHQWVSRLEQHGHEATVRSRNNVEVLFVLQLCGLTRRQVG
ncbi:hypothetical protein D3C86_2061600 [compost metagenome]